MENQRRDGGVSAPSPEDAARALEAEEAGLSLTFYERLDAAPVDEKLRLAREAAGHPRFDEEDAFEIGSRVELALEEAGRYAELEGVLDVWRERAPRVYAAEPAVRTWRVELALRLPDRDVKGPLVALARQTGDCGLVMRLAEWALYRGRLEEAWLGLLEAWPRVREDESLVEWSRVDYVTRAVLTCMDVSLAQTPALSREELMARLAPFARAVPHWTARALVLRTGRQPWTRRSHEEVRALLPEDFFDEQRALVLSFETELRRRQGWPWGRTQLIFPELFHLLPGPFGHGGEVSRARHLLLPTARDVEHWVQGMPEERTLHPHVHAATALALRPWGEFLHGLGLVDAEELAEWWEQCWELLTGLPEQLLASNDPLLLEEAHRSLRGGWPHGGR